MSNALYETQVYGGEFMLFYPLEYLMSYKVFLTVLHYLLKKKVRLKQ